MEKGNITIYGIAKEAGVSVATVSRVINRPENVKPEKREKVLAVIRRYDFKPNMLAKSLKNARSGVIGLLTASIDSPFYGQLVSECIQAAKECGYVLLVSSFKCGGEEEADLLKNIYKQRVESIILLGGGMDSRTENEQILSAVNRIAEVVPVVVMGNAQGIPCYEVRIDEAGAMEQAMEYLIGAGHRKIAFWGGEKNVYSITEKSCAFQRMLRKYGLECRDEWLQYGGYDQEDGYRVMSGMNKDELPTAVIGVNDQFACGIIKAAFDTGIAVPQKLSVISFDNTYIAECTRPELSSVACDYGELAHKLVQTAVKAARREEMEWRQLVWTHLVERESSMPLTETDAH